MPGGRPRGCSSMAEHQLPKLTVRVRFSSPAPVLHMALTNRASSPAVQSQQRRHPTPLSAAPCPAGHAGRTASRTAPVNISPSQKDPLAGPLSDDTPGRPTTGNQA